LLARIGLGEVVVGGLRSSGDKFGRGDSRFHSQDFDGPLRGTANGVEGEAFEAARIAMEDGAGDRIPRFNPLRIVAVACSASEERKKRPPGARQDCHNLWTIKDELDGGNPNRCFREDGVTFVKRFR